MARVAPEQRLVTACQAHPFNRLPLTKEQLMHYYQHHIGDFIKATSRLTDSQVMAYLRLIWLYYDKDGVVANDPEQISFEIGSDVKTIQMIIKTYFEIEGDWLKHSRCDKELQGYLNKSEGGKKGAERRWKNKVSHGLPMGIPMLPQSNPNANQEPITNNQISNIGVAKATKGSRFAKKDQIPPSWESYCKEKRPDLKPADVYESFADYWIAVPGAKGVKLDWDATWRTWIRNQRQNFQGTQDKPTVAWHQTLGGVMAKGKELGIEPRPGETEGQYRQRLIQGGA